MEQRCSKAFCDKDADFELVYKWYSTFDDGFRIERHMCCKKHCLAKIEHLQTWRASANQNSRYNDIDDHLPVIQHKKLSPN